MVVVSRIVGHQGMPVSQVGGVVNLADDVFGCLEECGWAGPDPYDGLLSPLAGMGVHRVVRQAVVQGVKRCPVDVRPLLGIRRLRTATACGVGASACSRLDELPVWADRARRLGAWTASQQLAGRYAGLWGYEFDVQTRWGFYPAGVPNIVATTFCADGCLDSGVLAEEGVSRLGEGLLEHLFTGRFFAYTPLSRVLVHNANVMGAALAVRLSGAAGVSGSLAGRLVDAARSALAVTVEAQRSDGSWPYGEEPGLEWVDGFHTGYVLMRLQAAGAGAGVDVEGVVRSGAAFYFSRLFDGPVPRYFAGERPGWWVSERRDSNNDATAVRMAVWGADRGFVPGGFASEVLGAVAGGFPVLRAGRGGGSSGGVWRPVRWSPRWSLAPLLDALTAVAVGRG